MKEAREKQKYTTLNISTSMRQKLDEIVKIERRKIRDIIEIMIETKHDQIFKGVEDGK